jgi:hypothetical protein
MKRLAGSLVLAAIVLVPAVSFAQGSQPRPTTQVIPCDAACKSQHCVDMCNKRANMVCGAGDAHYACVQRSASNCEKACMR